MLSRQSSYPGRVVPLDASAWAEVDLFHPAMYCPIGFTLMEDPVIDIDGHSYERKNIEKWFRTSHHSPMTGLTMSNKSLYPNRALKLVIEFLVIEFNKKRHAQRMAAKLMNQTPSTRMIPRLSLDHLQSAVSSAVSSARVLTAMLLSSRPDTAICQVTPDVSVATTTIMDQEDQEDLDERLLGVVPYTAVTNP
jgi:hypothetical protein